MANVLQRQCRDKETREVFLQC